MRLLFLPKVTERMMMKISTNHSLTALMTGNGNIKLIDSATSPCRDNNHQIIDHILYECEILNTQTGSLKLTVSTTDSWPANKYTLISRHYTAFKKFINQIHFDELQ
jgi:hypothetical protein